MCFVLFNEFLALQRCLESVSVWWSNRMLNWNKRLVHKNKDWYWMFFSYLESTPHIEGTYRLFSVAGTLNKLLHDHVRSVNMYWQSQKGQISYPAVVESTAESSSRLQCCLWSQNDIISPLSYCCWLHTLYNTNLHISCSDERCSRPPFFLEFPPKGFRLVPSVTAHQISKGAIWVNKLF